MKDFQKSLISIALPVTLQSLLQSSFSVIDQVMIGQMGSESIAGIGLGGKFASVYSVVLGAVAAVAGIMIAQYIGQKNEKNINKGFYVNLMFAAIIATVFMTVCLIFTPAIMSVYTKDTATSILAEKYLRIYSLSFIPMAVSTMAAVLLRCLEAAVFPLVASFVSVLVNTALNYLLIFGKFGFPKLGVEGAAIASVASQMAACLLTLGFMIYIVSKTRLKLKPDILLDKKEWKQYFGIFAPILACEFMWIFGENVYAAIYGNIGTDACAAMTMTGPIQGLMIGALSGLSQAAGIMIGKALGNNEYDTAYSDSKKLIKYGLAGSIILSVLLIVFGKYYVLIYNVDTSVQTLCYRLLIVFAIVSPIKVQNMIIGGGIIRSGGKTKYVMWIDIIGTWIFGVPLGLLSAFVLKIPITYVYFILSQEELIRLIISLVIFRKKIWMDNI